MIVKLRGPNMCNWQHRQLKQPKASGSSVQELVCVQSKKSLVVILMYYIFVQKNQMCHVRH